MPRGTRAQKLAKRQVVVAGKIAGISTPELARQAGCSERHVERIAAEPESELLARDMLKPHMRQLRQLMTKSLNAVGRGLEAKLKTPHDHRAQLQAVGRLQGFVEWLGRDSDAVIDATPRRFAGTMEELLVLYRQVTVRPPAVEEDSEQ